MSIDQDIKNEAKRLGFALVGITTAEAPPHTFAYENWLRLGRHGSMEYLASERARKRRQDARLILPGCRSIITLGLRYPKPLEPEPKAGTEPTGRIAAYAWGRDYHLFIPERLQALVNFLEEQLGRPISYRCYTDSGPILERDLAQRAGLGWIGKNTCLINPKLGSYFLLAEILLDISLEPDAPFVFDRCGKCTRCVDACPTGCILPDRTLDARRCISYLTIENKEEIPYDLRSLTGKWVFGCDICQMVCPWNRFATEEYDIDLAQRPGLAEPELEADLLLTSQTFNTKFKESPVQRARRRGYQRNVAVALGNMGNPKSIPALDRAVKDDDALVRQHAEWALEQIHNGQRNDPG